MGTKNFKRKWSKSVFYFYFGTKNMVRVNQSCGNGFVLTWFGLFGGD